MSRPDFEERLAQIPDEMRQNLEARHRERFEPRTDGGLAFSLDDHLWQVYRAKMFSISVREHSRTLGLPESYLRALRTALQLG